MSLIGRRWRWTRHRVGCISTARPWRATQGAPSNYTNLCDEPADHALGRSRGGLTTKIHQLCDGQGLPLVVLIGPGHAHDSPMFDPLMGQLRVPRLGPAGRVLDRQRCWAIRPTRRAHTGHVCAPGESARSSPNRPPKSITADAAAAEAGARSASTSKNTSAATSSNDPSTSSRTGAGWPPATTNSP